MGVVYRATDLELRREVAVKVLPGSATTPEARERLLREARAAAALNHPHIVAVYDVGETQGTPFLVMELVHGPSLARTRPVEIGRVVEIACQICAALEHAHANSIVHRDLKPDNVLLSAPGEFGNVKLADLGLALPGYGERISRTGVIMGTASYMAPEQALGGRVDGRTDLYALGVLLYEFTTGRLPFSGDNSLAIVSQHVHAPVVPPCVLRPDLPRALEAVILRLLAKDPAARFADAAQTAKALRQSITLPERHRKNVFPYQLRFSTRSLEVDWLVAQRNLPKRTSCGAVHARTTVTQYFSAESRVPARHVWGGRSSYRPRWMAPLF